MCAKNAIISSYELHLQYVRSRRWLFAPPLLVLIAQAYCGDLYTFGFGVAKDDRLAFVYHEKAAQQGHPGAQFNTGVYYREGQGCEQSYGRAAEWFEKAALQGDASAKQALGYAYQLGRGVPQSVEKAFELYSQGAALGDPDGQNSLGVCYRLGRDASRALSGPSSYSGRVRHRGT